MKPTHLKTLSAYIDDQSVQDQSTIQFKCNVQDYNESLKQSVTLAHFVACDANGVPLEELPEVIHSKEQLALKYQYVRSQKSVIFEGWEVVNNISIISNFTGDRIQFFKNGNVFYDKKIYKGVYEGLLVRTNPTLADLAAATTENPIKLK